MNTVAAHQFAAWLYNEHPKIFKAILKEANPQALGDISDTLSDVGSSISDTFSSITGSIGDAVGSVGSWVSNPSNVSALSTAATAFFKSQAATSQANAAQSSVLNTQLSRLSAGVSPAPISYATNAAGQLVPVSTTPVAGSTQVSLANGQVGYALSQSSLNSLQPGVLQKYGIYLLIGGAVLVAVIALK